VERRRRRLLLGAGHLGVGSRVGFLWTPPYWAWVDGGFVFYDGYWGPHVGFYGGIVNGFGYFGKGFEGGRWDNGTFFYNRAVTNVNVTNIHNVYNTTVVNNTTSPLMPAWPPVAATSSSIAIKANTPEPE